MTIQAHLPAVLIDQALGANPRIALRADQGGLLGIELLVAFSADG
jgi:hypothetical protein